jgi:hypothetical protein
MNNRLNTIERQKVATDLLEAAGFEITELSVSDDDGSELTAVSEAGETFSGLSDLGAVERAIDESKAAANG